MGWGRPFLEVQAWASKALGMLPQPLGPSHTRSCSHLAYARVTLVRGCRADARAIAGCAGRAVGLQEPGAASVGLLSRNLAGQVQAAGAALPASRRCPLTLHLASVVSQAGAESGQAQPSSQLSAHNACFSRKGLP